jgi:hypothetical protein
MSDIELVVKKSKSFEALLEAAFQAEGRGLHEKITSVESKLPEHLIKKLRYIATVRNKLVHTHQTDHIDDRRRFEETCDEVETQLRSHPAYIHRSIDREHHGATSYSTSSSYGGHGNSAFAGYGCLFIVALTIFDGVARLMGAWFPYLIVGSITVSAFFLVKKRLYGGVRK